MNPHLLIAGLLGLTAVSFGAYAEHGLRPQLSDQQWHSLQVAMRYHLLHAVVLAAIGLALSATLPARMASRLRWSGWAFVLGTVMFSFTIYLSAVTGWRGLSFLTPPGGMVLMAGWALLGWSALAAAKH